MKTQKKEPTAIANKDSKDQAITKPHEAGEDLWLVLRTSIFPGARDESIAMALAYCKSNNLNILQKPVHIVPMSVKDAKTGTYEWRDVVMPGIGHYRTQASRTGQYVGMSEPKYGEVIEREFQDKNGKVHVRFPEWCEITVYRVVGGIKCAFPAREYWLENYATSGRDSQAPNSMWRRRPYGQLTKCAEAQALRKAFPEFGAQPTAEEVEGKMLEETVVIGKPAVKKPLAITEKKAEPIEEAEDLQESPSESVPPDKEPEADSAEELFDSPSTPTEPTLYDTTVRMIRKSLNDHVKTEQELLKHFGYPTVESMPRKLVNDILSWIMS